MIFKLFIYLFDLIYYFKRRIIIEEFNNEIRFQDLRSTHEQLKIIDWIFNAYQAKEEASKYYYLISKLQ